MFGRRTRTNNALAPLVPLVGAVAVGVMRIIYRKQILGAPAAPSIGVSSDSLMSAQPLSELPRVMMIGSSFMVTISVLAVTYVVVPLIAWRSAHWLGRYRKWVLLAAVGMGVTAAVQSASREQALLKFNLLIVDTLLQFIPPEHSPVLGPSLSTVREATCLLDGLATAVDFLLLTAVCCLVGPHDDGRDLKPEQTVEVLLSRLSSLDALLYIGATMLLTHLFRMGTLASWCGAFFKPELQPVMARVGEAIVAVDGMFFSLMIFAVYGPAATFLTRRAHTLARSQVCGTIERRQWLRERGFSISLADWLPRVGAALAPAVGGALRVVY